MALDTPTWDETQPVEAGPSWDDTEPLETAKKSAFLSSAPRVNKPSLLDSFSDTSLANKLADTLDKSIIPEGSLSSGPRNYDSRGNIIPSDAEKLLRPLVTPKNAAIMLATAGEGLIPRIAGGVFGAQGAKGVYDAAKVLSDPNADPQAKHDAGLSMFLNAPMAVMGAHGALHGEPKAEVQGPLANGSILETPRGAEVPKWEETAPIAPNETQPEVPTSKVKTRAEVLVSQEPATPSPTPEVNNAPLKNSGAYADLSPELKAKSDSVKDAMRAQFEALKAPFSPPAEPALEPIVDQSVNKGEVQLTTSAQSVSSEGGYDSAASDAKLLSDSTKSHPFCLRDLAASISKLKGW